VLQDSIDAATHRRHVAATSTSIRYPCSFTKEPPEEAVQARSVGAENLNGSFRLACNQGVVRLPEAIRVYLHGSNEIDKLEQTWDEDAIPLD
jgi:hypothetical protein